MKYWWFTFFIGHQLAVILVLADSLFNTPDKPVVLQIDLMKDRYLELCPYPLSLNFPDEYGILTNFTKPLEIEIGFIVTRLVEINDIEKRMSLFGEISMFWHYPCNVSCEQLLPNSSSKLCSQHPLMAFSSFFQPKTQTWYPKFLQMNGYKQGAPLDTFFDYTYVGMFASIAYIAAIGTIDSACDSFSFKRFPFDVLSCDVKLYTVDLTDKVSFIITRYQIQDGATLVSDPEIWEHVPPLTANTTLFPFVNGIKDNGLWFNIKFRRKYEYFVCSIVLPAIALVILQVAGLIMPPEMPDRSSYSITVVLAYMLLLSMIFSEIPRTSEPVYFVYMVTANLWAGVVLTIYSLITCELAMREDWRKVVILSNNGLKIQKIRLLDLSVGTGICFTLLLLDGTFYGMMLQ